MKNQYFGDNKDLFTYDLILQVMLRMAMKQFTFIPMLTKNDDTGHGRRYNRTKAKAGAKNKELVDFLDRCVNADKRDIEELRDFFEGYGLKTTIYYGKRKYFCHQLRQEYFKQVGDELLPKSLVFVGPDNGLEVARPNEKHVLYTEVKDLYERMDKDSILMLYQYFPRQPHLKYLNKRCGEIKDRITGEYPVCIDDDEIAFFSLTKNEELEESLIKVISEYRGYYSK